MRFSGQQCINLTTMIVAGNPLLPQLSRRQYSAQRGQRWMRNLTRLRKAVRCRTASGIMLPCQAMLVVLIWLV